MDEQKDLLDRCEAYEELLEILADHPNHGGFTRSLLTGYAQRVMPIVGEDLYDPTGYVRKAIGALLRARGAIKQDG
jgi:hypothetical protein